MWEDWNYGNWEPTRRVGLSGAQRARINWEPTRRVGLSGAQRARLTLALGEMGYGFVGQINL
jgi:hypothetical protein